MSERISNVVSWAFGILLIALSAFVALETVARKLFNYSFQGADELGGYVLAIGGGLSFVVALFGRAHIRIDLVHARLPAGVQGVLNWLATLMMAGVGLFLAVYCAIVLSDTLDYRSTAATPWATPLIYPQGAWYAGLLVFAMGSTVMAAVATWALLTGRITELNARFGPRGAIEELGEELEDIDSR